MKTFKLLTFVLVLVCAAGAAEITGTVTNKSTDKPSASDTVVLLKLQQGMSEVGRTKSNSKGEFTLKVEDEKTPHLIRVEHEGANYFRPAPPGTTSVEVEVYDSATKLEGVSQAFVVKELQTQGDTLQIMEAYDIVNKSQPPRTLGGDKTLEIVLPDGAKIDNAKVTGPGGMPIGVAANPGTQKNHYVFNYPIRPGETLFQILYTLPYSGSAELTTTVLQPTQKVAVTLPSSMKLDAPNFSLAKSETGLQVYVASDIAAGKTVPFKVSGTGALPNLDEQGGEQPAAQQPAPGGGLGVPENTPDPLYKYRWWIIAAVAVLLVAGAAFSMSRPAGASSAALSPDDRLRIFLEQIKEELFELESQRINGGISQADYEKTKAAMDVIMHRAMKQKEVAGRG